MHWTKTGALASPGLLAFLRPVTCTWIDTSLPHVPSKARQLGRRGGEPSATPARTTTYWPGAIAFLGLMAVIAALVFLWQPGDNRRSLTQTEFEDVLQQSSLVREARKQEIIDRFQAGQVLLVRYELFNRGGAFVGVRTPAIFTEYPERITTAIWRALDEGSLINVAGALRTMDGLLLARIDYSAGYPVYTDARSGETWDLPPSSGADIVRTPGPEGQNLTTVLDDFFGELGKRGGSGMSAALDSLLEKPSIVFHGSDSGNRESLEYEHQLENPWIFRQTRWQKRDFGEREMLSEQRIVEFSFLPPGAGPDRVAETE